MNKYMNNTKKKTQKKRKKREEEGGIKMIKKQNGKKAHAIENRINISY